MLLIRRQSWSYGKSDESVKSDSFRRRRRVGRFGRQISYHMGFKASLTLILLIQTVRRARAVNCCRFHL